jgi:hypothetical protein
MGGINGMEKLKVVWMNELSLVRSQLAAVNSVFNEVTDNEAIDQCIEDMNILEHIESDLVEKIKGMPA